MQKWRDVRCHVRVSSQNALEQRTVEQDTDPTRNRSALAHEALEPKAVDEESAFSKPSALTCLLKIPPRLTTFGAPCPRNHALAESSRRFL
jgi:hypothetical protein